MTAKTGEISRRAFVALLGRKCERCNSSKRLHNHHKDRNRRNNSVANHETLCIKCHMLEHDCASHFANQYTPKRRAEISKLMKARHAAGLVNVNTKKQRQKASKHMAALNKTLVRTANGYNQAKENHAAL